MRFWRATCGACCVLGIKSAGKAKPAVWAKAGAADMASRQARVAAV
jgi:hypothetical protein